MPDIELARREGVELVRTGRFQTLTGTWNPTPADIKAAVEAMDCPAIRKPVIRIGHTDKRFQISGDGEPALGWFENLRAADHGHTLVADQVTLPWLHSVQAAAYPSRSIEGNYNHRCSEGHTHPFVIHTVALLGVTPPGVQTLRSLNDLPEMLGVAASGEVPEGAERVQVTVMAADAEQVLHTGAMVALIPTAEDAARLAVDGGEPADELHVTLAYLGEAAELGAQGKQDVIDSVSRAVNGLPVIEADVFAASVFNPGDAQPERDPCHVYLITGDPVDAVHDLVDEAILDAAMQLWPGSSPIPPQHRPWFAHLTAEYTGDLSRLASLTGRMGPVTFDRIRLAFGGEVIDIPLIPDEERDPAMEPVAASTRDVIQERISALRADREVRASAPVLPAAEPEPMNTEPKEDSVPTELSGLRSRLGLPDDADLTAIEAKVDEIKADAEKTPEPTPEMVAASAAAVQENAELQALVEKLSARMEDISGELAAVKAEKVATVKASVLEAAVREGKIKPAERDQWEKDYDEAPGVTTRILASIAPGTAVPVMASGTTGPAEPAGGDIDSEYEQLTQLLDAPKAV